MKTRFFVLPKGLALTTLITACIGAGLSLPLLEAMQLFSAPAVCFGACALVALLFALFECIPRLHALLYPLLLGALVFILWQYRDQVTAIGCAASLFLNGQPLALAAYSRVITVLLSILLTGVGASLAKSEYAFFPLALLTVAELMAVSFLGLSSGAAAMYPLLLALLLASRTAGVTTRRILPMAALTLACTSLLMPMAGNSVPALRTLAEKTRRMIDDYTDFSEARTTFTLASAGWQPYGQERMGGRVMPTNDPVMQVKTPGNALLRATAKNEYTGLAWADTISGHRYLYVSPRFAGLREDVFDTERPEKSLRAMLPGSRTLHVEMLADSASTLFLTQRFLSPKGEGVVSYFSPSSEVFGTRSLTAGSSYAFSGRIMTAATEGVRAAVMTAHDPSDPYYETVRQTYLSLPTCIEEKVYEIAREITSYADNDFDRAAALCTYLQRAFPYSLDQSEPPLTRDFVSWFLLEEKKGYCTSFASAMTVLARCAGLPARYIEGYSVVPDEDGMARVTQMDAHAWSEVYFPGFGWLSFDATPGSGNTPDYGGGNNAPDDSSPGDLPDGSDDSENPDTPEENGDSPEETPSPSPTPTPTPTPVPTPSPTPTPEHNDPAVTPTPKITPAPTPVPTAEPTPTPPAPKDDPDTPPHLIAWLLSLLLAIAVTLRFVFTAPPRVAQRYRNPADQLLVYYRACEQSLCAMGIAPQSGEAPATYLWRAHEALSGRVNLTGLGKAVCLARYSGKRTKPQAVHKAEKTYRSLLASMKPLQRIQMHLVRFVRGIHL